MSDTVATSLRVAHFVGMHALQALPLLGWLLERQRVPRAPRWVQLSAGLISALTMILLLQALAGRALLDFG